MMRRRSALAEHPFGTLKCRAGYRHFLVRGFDKVRGEWSLMALCYNFSRVLSILGLDSFMAYLANHYPACSDRAAQTPARRHRHWLARRRARCHPISCQALSPGGPPDQRPLFLPSLFAPPGYKCLPLM